MASTGFRRVSAAQRDVLDVLMQDSCRRGRAGLVEAAGAGDAPSVASADDPHQVRRGSGTAAGDGC
jgi:hypothetical protein